MPISERIASKSMNLLNRLRASFDPSQSPELEEDPNSPPMPSEVALEEEHQQAEEVLADAAAKEGKSSPAEYEPRILTPEPKEVFTEPVYDRASPASPIQSPAPASAPTPTSSPVQAAELITPSASPKAEASPALLTAPPVLGRISDSIQAPQRAASQVSKRKPSMSPVVLADGAGTGVPPFELANREQSKTPPGEEEAVPQDQKVEEHEPVELAENAVPSPAPDTQDQAPQTAEERANEQEAIRLLVITLKEKADRADAYDDICRRAIASKGAATGTPRPALTAMRPPSRAPSSSATLSQRRWTSSPTCTNKRRNWFGRRWRSRRSRRRWSPRAPP